MHRHLLYEGSMGQSLHGPELLQLARRHKVHCDPVRPARLQSGLCRGCPKQGRRRNQGNVHYFLGGKESFRGDGLHESAGVRTWLRPGRVPNTAELRLLYTLLYVSCAR